MSQTTVKQAARTRRPFKLIGELMNNSFARAARAFQARDVAKFQELAILQTEFGANFLTLNIDSTQRMMVKMDEMLEFLPTLIPAIQEATDTPISFDNPAVQFHQTALKLYKRTDNNQPILNSVAASRHDLDGMIELVAKYDTKVIIMASERFTDGGGDQCTTAREVYEATKHHVKLLRDKAGRKNTDMIVDPGLAPISTDTYGLVNMGLDSIELIRNDTDLEGIHISVGLTNFSFGLPKDIREGVENAYITLALAKGLDYVLGNPEKDLHLLKEDSRYMKVVRKSLAEGRPKDGETQEDAGFRQANVIMELFSKDNL
jgi:cobalamin-dependent methionine synthase I